MGNKKLRRRPEMCEGELRLRTGGMKGGLDEGGFGMKTDIALYFL